MLLGVQCAIQGRLIRPGRATEAGDGEQRRRLGGVAHGGRRGGRPSDHGSVASGGRARATRFGAKPGARRPLRPFPGRFAVAGVRTA